MESKMGCKIIDDAMYDEYYIYGCLMIELQTAMISFIISMSHIKDLTHYYYEICGHRKIPF